MREVVIAAFSWRLLSCKHPLSCNKPSDWLKTNPVILKTQQCLESRIWQKPQFTSRNVLSTYAESWQIKNFAHICQGKKTWMQAAVYINTQFLLSVCAISLVFSHLSPAPLMSPIAAPILLVQMKPINTICPARYQARSLVQTQQLEPLHTGAAPHYLKWRRLLEGEKNNTRLD